MGKFTPWLVVLAVIAILGSVWAATTPEAVPAPAASVWAQCFGRIQLPYAAEDADLMLVRHPALDGAEASSDYEPANLLAIAVKPISVELAPEERKTFADRRLAELPLGRAIEVQATTVRLHKGRLELRRTDGSRFLVDARDSPVQFELPPDDAYRAELIRPTKVTFTGTGSAALPLGSEVSIVLPPNQPLVVKQIKRLWVTPLLLPDTAARILAPDVQPSRETAPFLWARLTAPGLEFDDIKETVRACLWSGDGAARRLQVASVESLTPGDAEVVLELPSEPLSWYDLRSRKAVLAVVAGDGMYAGIGEFVYHSRLWALGGATIMAGAIFFLLVWGYCWGKGKGGWKKHYKRRLMGLFVGEDNEPSLSSFQILLWTIVTVWSLLFVFISTGDLLTMTQQVMALLGFAGAGSLAARWAASTRRPAQGQSEITSSTTPGEPQESAASGQAPPSASTSAQGGSATDQAEEKELSFSAILKTNKRPDLFKVQLFVFTVLIAIYVVSRVVSKSAFPEIDPEFLTLMGISNSLYVGSKFGPSPGTSTTGSGPD